MEAGQQILPCRIEKDIVFLSWREMGNYRGRRRKKLENGSRSPLALLRLAFTIPSIIVIGGILSFILKGDISYEAA